MLNQIVLVGRLTRDIQVRKSDKGIKFATISLAIPRSFKNMEGTYDTDFIDCIAFENIAENRAYSKSDYIPAIAWGRTARFCDTLETGTQVKAIGRVQSRVVEKESKNEYLMEVVAEKVTFLSSKRKEADKAE